MIQAGKAKTERLFENPFIEKMTHTHIAVPISIFVIYSSTLVAISLRYHPESPLLSIGMFALGWLSFTWVEYITHRHVFHMEIYTAARKKIQYMIHGVHHQYPKDKDRLAMPPVLSISIATALLFILKFLIGNLVFVFLPGFLLGYAFYLLIHYIVHAHRAPKNMFRRLWINHGIHHYKDHDICFGVSSPLWDHVYGTVPKSKISSTE